MSASIEIPLRDTDEVSINIVIKINFIFIPHYLGYRSSSGSVAGMPRSLEHFKARTFPA